jgi:hypothetical protein
MPDNLIHNIIVKLDSESEKSIDFVLEESSTLFIDDYNKGTKVSKGKHVLKVKRHHDFFFDWSIDDILIEEFLVVPLICDEEIISIKSSYPVIIDNTSNIHLESILIFPIEYNPLDQLKISLTCLFPSQLSFYFDDDKNNFKTLTLQFSEDNYCKVFLDEFYDGKFIKDKRKNMGLFNTKITLENIIVFDTQNEIISISNSLGKKIYEISSYLKLRSKLIINETWSPNGKGKYLIERIL